MQIGDLVRAVNLSLFGWNSSGIVIAICGPKWVKVAWSDGIIYEEHVEDLETNSTAPT